MKGWFLKLCLIILAIGLGIFALRPFIQGMLARASAQHNILVLVDNSKSPLAGKKGHPDFLPSIMEVGQLWIKNAESAPGSLFEIWTFDSSGVIETERKLSIALPTQAPPVYRWRRMVKEEVKTKIEKVVKRGDFKPKQSFSPIIEVAWRLMKRGEELPGDCELYLITDLLQTSKNFTLTPTYLSAHSDEEMIHLITKKFPAVAKPPRIIVIYYYPGIGTGKPDSGDYEERLIRLFTKLFRENWHIPDVRFEALK